MCRSGYDAYDISDVKLHVFSVLDRISLHLMLFVQHDGVRRFQELFIQDHPICDVVFPKLTSTELFQNFVLNRQCNHRHYQQPLAID